MKVIASWESVVEASAAGVSALGIVILLIAAILAYHQLRETRRAREAETGLDLLRRWNEDPLVCARQKVTDCEEDAHALEELVRKERVANTKDYYVLIREPEFFESVGVLHKRKVVDYEFIRDAMISAIIQRWHLWQPAIEYLRHARRQPTLYKEFEALARKLEQERPAEQAHVEQPNVAAD